MTGVTAGLAAFIADARFEDLPAKAVRLATDAITDSIGVGLLGSRQPVADILLRVVPRSPSADGFLLGVSDHAHVLESALYNGAAIHAVDYDDTAHPSYSHPSAHLVPVLLALGRQFHRTGRELVLAYVIGLEVEAKLGRSLNMDHYLRGWHSTGTLGAVSSAASASKLAGLDDHGTAVALAIAASAASGLRANFGTMTKPLHAGLAARSGVLSALLAQEGFTAAPDVLEDRYGYLKVFGTGNDTYAEVFQRMADPWEITTPYGIALKLFPACGSTHPAIEASLALRHDLAGATPSAVRVGTNELCSQTLVYTDPQSPLEAKFSMEFCVAAALVRGEVVMTTFTPEVLRDPEIQSLMKRITVEVDDRVRFNTEHGAVVSVETTDRRKFERLVPLARGKPDHWLTADELWTKFRDCARVVLSESQARDAFDQWQRLAEADSLEPLLSAIRFAPSLLTTA